MDEDIRKNTPVSAKQTGKCVFEVTMLDGSVRKFYRGDVAIHHIFQMTQILKLRLI